MTTNVHPLRLWPGALLLLLLWILRSLPRLVPEQSMVVLMTSFVGPVACALGIWVWWTFFSRAPSRERRLGSVGLVLVLVGTTLLADSTFRGFGTASTAIPWGFTAFTLALFAAHLAGSGRRVEIALAVSLLGFGFWTLVRVDGVWGDFTSQRSWRWETAVEDRSLAEFEARTDAAPVSPTQLADGSWPEFRGSGRSSTLPGVALEEDWSAHPPKELWRISVGPGWSSFAAAGGRLFTQEQRGDEEVVASYDAATGREIWVYGVPARFWEAQGGVGPRATPTLSQGRLFALGAEGLLHRLDAATGERVWQADLRRDAAREPPTWGFTSSPLVVGDQVIVYAGGEGDRGVLAYDVASGEVRWGAPAGDHTYSSPQLSILAGRPTIALVTNDGLAAFDPTDGRVLLEYSWPFENYRVLQPLVLDEATVFMSTGFGRGTKRLEISPSGDRLQAREVWTSRALKPDFNDYVAHEGHLYGFDPGILVCVDLETGERRWKGGRYGHGQLLLLPDADQLLVLSEKGEIVLVRADPSGHQELAKRSVLAGKTWNHPVLVGEHLYVRNGEEAVALEMTLR